jgi:hypothetical protein
MSMRGVIFHVPLDLAQTPKDGDCLVDRWWSVHPELGLAFWFQPFGYERSEEPSPQCNPDEATARMLALELLPDHEVRQIKCVFMAHAMREMIKRKRELAKAQVA